MTTAFDEREFQVNFPMPTDSIRDFIENTRLTLQYWIDVHTKAGWWAAYWIGDEDIDWHFGQSPVLSNNYFTFDWKAAAIRRWYKAHATDVRQCSKCGCMYDRGCEPDACDSCGGRRYRTPSVQDMLDNEYGYFEEGMPGGNRDNDILWEALVKDGFPTYYEALRPLTTGIVSEVKDALDDYAKCSNNAELLAWATWAMHIQHVHGTIFRDYGGGQYVSYDLTDRVQQDGLVSVFSQDEIDGFLGEDN